MKLNLLFPHLNIDESIHVFSLENDSRLVTQGSLFIAYRGFQFDGHQYIEDAYQKGCRYFLISKDRMAEFEYLYPDSLFIGSENIKKEASEIALKFYDYPDEHLILIGITGTNGKTTVATLIHESLLMQNHKTAFFGTICWKVADKTYPALNTTPDFLILIKLLRDAVDLGVEYVIMEISSHALSMGRVDGLNFNYIVFTNLTQDHLDYHSSMEDYFLTKSRLFTDLLAKSTKNHKQSFINADDSYGQALLKMLKKQCIPYESFSSNALGEWNATDISLSLSGSTFNLVHRGHQIHLKTPLLGLINVENTIIAYGVLNYLGCSEQSIVDAFKKITIPGRLQKFCSSEGVIFFIDYAHTPDALSKSIDVVNRLLVPPAKSIVLFGAGGDRDVKKRPLMAQAAIEADIIIITSDNPRSENPDKIIGDIMKGFGEDLSVYCEPDRFKALNLAYKIAEKGDVILVAGKGHEDYQIIGTEKIYFSDFEHIKNICNGIKE